MKKDFIYIRICDGMNLSKTKIILKDKCNKIVYEEIIVNLNNIKIPIYNNDIYKLFIVIFAKHFSWRQTNYLLYQD